MKRLEQWLMRALFILLMLMIILVTIQVINRYGTKFSIPWTEELTRIAYILLIFIGSALATLQCNHVRVTGAAALLPAKAAKALAVFCALASSVFFIFVAYGAYRYTLVNLDSVFPTMSWLTIGYVMAIVFIMSLLMSGLFAYQIFKPCPEKRPDIGDSQ